MAEPTKLTPERISAALRVLAQCVGQDQALTMVAQTLRQHLGVAVGLFDVRGTVLAAAPARARWSQDEVLAAAREPQAGLVASPIIVAGDVAGIVAAARPDDTGGVVDFAASLVALEIGRLQAELAGRRQLVGQVLEDVAHRKVPDHQAEVRLDEVGVRVDEPFHLVVGTADAALDRFRALPWNLHALLSGTGDPLVRAWVGGHMLVVVPARSDEAAVGDVLYRQLSQFTRGARVGISAEHVGLGGFRVAFFEAFEASGRGPGITRATSLDLARLLILSNTDLPLTELGERLLEPLREYDAKHDGELARTLRVYLKHNRQQAPTIAEMFIHRNTLRYRLGQIQQLLSISLESSPDLTNVWLALLLTEPAYET